MLIYAMAFSGRESMANRIRPIVVNEQDRRELERLQRSPSAPAGLTRRARAVLMMAQDVPGVEIAERTGYTVVQVSRLRRRFAEYGAQPNPAVAALATWAAGAADPRLSPQWADEPVCGPRDRERPGHRRVRLAAHRRRFLALHEATRPSLPWPRTARRPRQLLHPFDTSGPRLAREASQRRISLHAQGRVLAQHGRSLVRHSDA